MGGLDTDSQSEKSLTMAQKEITLLPQKIFSSSRAYPSDREVAYAEKIHATDLLDMSFIAKIHKFGSKDIANLKQDKIASLTADFDSYQSSYEDSYIWNYFQLVKGQLKSEEQIHVIDESQLKSNSPAFLIYEKDMRTDEGVFSERIQSIETDKEKWVVLERESKRILEKIEVAISHGIKSFIIRAGKYEDELTWKSIINNIQDNEGTIIIALPKRRHGKVSFIKDFFRLGVDGVFHEVPEGRGGEILYLNENYEYVQISFAEAVKNFSDELKNLKKSYYYAFSRASALNTANNFAGTIEVFEIVKET